ncbi:hypothetical protein [Arthrobacter sp. ISL-65]|uniref:hypothetical protein n=1 Tax=Arthrobacter sp. ISL-65 TaxID=2819112 RepID=UPI001BE592D3|nr:hypothetical protein [Arthrobacter sp. ISL-65]MBT2549999.1 hypothetical protein [Arthrobacter sp. ISL-65]
MRRLLDEMTGSFRVTTRSGTDYLVCLDPPRYVIRFPGAFDQALEPANEVAPLRKDSEAIPLLRVVNLTVGQRGRMLLYVTEDGGATVRDTTEVSQILPLAGQFQMSDEAAAEIGRNARKLGWSRVFLMPSTAPPVFVLDASAARTLSSRSFHQLESAIEGVLGNVEFILDGAEYFDVSQLNEMREL